MKISKPGALTVAKQSNDYHLATGSVVVGGGDGVTRAYFELRIDSGGSDDYGGECLLEWSSARGPGP